MKTNRFFGFLLIVLGLGYLASMIDRYFRNQELEAGKLDDAQKSNDAATGLELKPVSKVLAEGESFTFPANFIYGLDITAGAEAQLKSGGGDIITLNDETYSFPQSGKKFSTEINIKSITGVTRLIYYV